MIIKFNGSIDNHKRLVSELFLLVSFYTFQLQPSGRQEGESNSFIIAKP